MRIIKKLGLGCTLAKTDVGSAFRVFPVHPKEYHLLGMKWRDKFYVDCCLPMGLASSCRSFEKLSTAMEWVTRNKWDIPHIIYVLNDFLIAAESPNKCRTNLPKFLHFCEVPMAYEKTEGTAQVLSFAGTAFDCNMQEARLPKEKVTKCLTAISTYKTGKSDLERAPIHYQPFELCLFSDNSRHSFPAQAD